MHNGSINWSSISKWKALDEIRRIRKDSLGLPNSDGESPNSNGEHLWGVSYRTN